ncbi:hypothetical protein BURPS1106B_2022 [Burkholderia pseudomallei 1106b]|uniref:Uncharacterized protein n=1 Tax=Burkholderia pseudomallei (strain 1106a) TaxID=357348 RepID=A3PA18_BURP0|nr:hypothetical protein BURPS1106A_A3149 [Burkholderia pseudomallei 1106a]AFR21018.1 hypothetical protein BPC006_II3095 [Burkholderia pseudomallei BPC006]EDS82028.1 hypothetical protein BURPSS13_0261 [Burkholderia pseudomallei S13]EDU10001.1 hypothetical protein BURPS1655_J0019 [Burkholderia pseudomallei 1655]EEH24739.1 conserved hypothetical protein [Burkholderia pseudomallei Pakistan 9]EES23347.1 hypothetical protein BURPS1106B_2022 [Burkholderia pseudomallei 1106b]
MRHEIAFAHHQCRTARCRSVECPPQPPGEYLFDYASRRRYAIHKSINALA